MTDPTIARPRHPLIATLVDRHGFAALDDATVEAFCSAPGTALIALFEDPAKYRETLDLAVIAPEVARAFPGAFRCAVLEPPAAGPVAARFGVRRWPALLFVRDGAYVGAIEGLREWSRYIEEVTSLLSAPTRRPPGIGIAVRNDDGRAASCREIA